MTQDRDPANPARVASALAIWLAAAAGSRRPTDEEDAALVGVLLDEGVLSPADIDDLYIESDSAEHGIAAILLDASTANSEEGMVWLHIEQDGSVSVYDI